MSSALLEQMCNFFSLWNLNVLNTAFMHTQKQQEKQTEICFEYDILV